MRGKRYRRIVQLKLQKCRWRQTKILREIHTQNKEEASCISETPKQEINSLSTNVNSCWNLILHIISSMTDTYCLKWHSQKFVDWWTIVRCHSDDYCTWHMGTVCGSMTLSYKHGYRASLPWRLWGLPQLLQSSADHLVIVLEPGLCVNRVSPGLWTSLSETKRVRTIPTILALERLATNQKIRSRCAWRKEVQH